MKKSKKVLAIILSCVMLITSFSVAALADVDNGSQTGQLITTDTTYNLEWNKVDGATGYKITVKPQGDETVAFEKEVAADESSVLIDNLPVGAIYEYIVDPIFENEGIEEPGTPEVPEEPKELGGVTNLRAIRGYNTVKIKWTPVEGAKGYKIYIDRYYGPDQKMPAKAKYNLVGAKRSSYVLKGFVTNRYYKIWVVPYVDKDDLSTYGKAKRIVTQKAHTLYYNVKFKEARTLQCHCCGRPKTRTFAAGTKFRAYGFSQGRYKFRSNGHTYYVSALSCKSAVSMENHKSKYSAEEAEYVIKEMKPYSKTKYLIWASLYGQQVYVFKKINGEYKVIKQFICGSGKAGTPSPTGKSKEIWQKLRTRHKRSYWSCFSSLNSFHNIFKSESLDGKTKSHGCIRLNTKDSKYIYENIPMNTRVIVF